MFVCNGQWEDRSGASLGGVANSYATHPELGEHKHVVSAYLHRRVLFASIDESWTTPADNSFANKSLVNVAFSAGFILRDKITNPAFQTIFLKAFHSGESKLKTSQLDDCYMFHSDKHSPSIAIQDNITYDDAKSNIMMILQLIALQ
eukprot:5644968-Amphidinium_carterae.3